MDDNPNPSILAAVEAGRGHRGGTKPEAWVRHRARLLTLALSGLTRVRLGGILGVSGGHAATLTAEACDAVLRGGRRSTEAEAACRDLWRRWCDRGDDLACDRVGRIAASTEAV